MFLFRLVYPTRLYKKFKDSMEILFKNHSFVSNPIQQNEEITEAAPADVGCGPLILEDPNVRKCLDGALSVLPQKKP